MSFKPTANHGFNQKDFELLKKIASFFSRIVTTPHILTEVSNHSDKLKGEAHQRLFAFLSVLLQNERKLHETTLPSARLVQGDEFIKFGLTDTAISQIAPGNHLVATVDFPLAGHLEKKGVDVINLNHLREQGWRS